MIKIVFADFDGTLFSHRTHCMPQSTEEAIQTLNRNGIMFCICTGRAKEDVEKFDHFSFRTDGMVASNGQIAFDADNRKVYDSPISGELKETLISLFEEKRVPICFSTENGFYINFVNDFVVQFEAAISSNPPQVMAYQGEKIYMAACFTETEEIKQEILDLSRIATVTSWKQDGYDVLAMGANKAIGIAELLKCYHIRPEEAMAVGDGENDVEMLQFCGIGVAMGNGIEETKACADYVTDDIDKDGFAKALQHFELI